MEADFSLISDESLKKAGPESGMKRSGSQLGFARSNSLDSFDELMTHDSRKRAREEDLEDDPKAFKDVSAIGVFSREAFENFGRKWKERMDADTDERVTKLSRKGVDKEDMESRLGLLSRSTVSTGLKDQVKDLFKDRTIPHVIAVIEGKTREPSLSLTAKVKDKEVVLNYTQVHFSQGYSNTGAKDDKQSMTVYVRDDLTNVYKVNDETVTRGANKIGTVAVNYETVDGTKYRSLLVHIPNAYVGTQGKDTTTHDAIEEYAQRQAALADPVIVTSYVGDTNFKQPMTENSVPSMGGHLPDGRTLNPQSSGARRDTNFMQGVPVGEGRSGHKVLQPATLNQVFINTNDLEREATDHNSMIHLVGHDSDLAGRNPAMNEEFYF